MPAATPPLRRCHIFIAVCRRHAPSERDAADARCRSAADVTRSLCERCRCLMPSAHRFYAATDYRRCRVTRAADASMPAMTRFAVTDAATTICRLLFDSMPPRRHALMLFSFTITPFSPDAAFAIRRHYAVTIALPLSRHCRCRFSRHWLMPPLSPMSAAFDAPMRLFRCHAITFDADDYFRRWLSITPIFAFATSVFRDTPATFLSPPRCRRHAEPPATAPFSSRQIFFAIRRFRRFLSFDVSSADSPDNIFRPPFSFYIITSIFRFRQAAADFHAVDASADFRHAAMPLTPLSPRYYYCFFRCLFRRHA
jgi:hypothetical protein